MSQTEVQLIKDAVIVNADISNSAAIDVSKISGALPAAGGTITGDVTFDGATAGRDIVFDRSDNALEFADNAFLKFGTGGDLSISHNGSNSKIVDSNSNAFQIQSDDLRLQSTGGESYFKGTANGAVELFHNNVKKFNTNANGIAVHGGTHFNSAAITGTPLTYLYGYAGSDAKGVTIESNEAALELISSSNGNHSSSLLLRNLNDGFAFINDNDTNSLRIRYFTAVSNDFNAHGVGNGLSKLETSAVFNEDGAVQLFHNNTKTFETTTEGASFDTASSSCVVRLISNTDAETVLQGFNSDFNIKAPSGGNVNILANASETAISCVANGAVELYHNGNRQVFTIDGGLNWQDNKKAEFGNSGDLQIFHDGSNSRISDNGTGNLILDGNQVIIQKNDNTEVSAKFISDGAVELYHNNVKSARTINTGVNGLLVGDDTYINSSINHGELIVRKDLNSPAQPDITQCARATIITNERTAGVNGYGGALFFGGQDVDTSDQYTVDLAAIGATTNGNDIGNAAASGFLDFYTRNGGSFGHKFRIEQDGDLLGTDTSIGTLSDNRLKENIEDFTFDINKFKQFQPKLFNWKYPDQHRDTPASGKHRGFIAQDLEAIDIELVSTYRIPKNNPEAALVDQITIETEEYKDVVAEGKTANLGRIDAMYISVINQLIAKVEALETKVAALEAA